jgi:hypothetical protein
MNDERRLETLVDLVKLTPDEFARFLPDLIVWYQFGREMQTLGAEVTGMRWRDDGKPGEIHSVEAHIVTEDGKDTGRVEVWPGTAYAEGGS